VADKLTLHEDPRSGNCYKIRLTAALLGVPLGRRRYDIMKGETRTAEFLSLVNPNGRIPVLEIACPDGVRFLPESNAACWFLAAGSSLIPDRRFAQADVLRWMFFEQYNHEPNIAALRFWLAFIGEANLSAAQRAAIPAKQVAGEDALAVMDRHLAEQHAAGRGWFVGAALSLADVALYAYTHVAEAGGFRLRDHRHICAWLERVAATPGYIAMA